eukprot:s90_g19.t1
MDLLPPVFEIDINLFEGAIESSIPGILRIIPKLSVPLRRSQLPSLQRRKHRRDGAIRLHRAQEMANPLALNAAGVLLGRAPDSKAATPSPLQRVRRTQLHRSAAESQT